MCSKRKLSDQIIFIINRTKMVAGMSDQKKLRRSSIMCIKYMTASATEKSPSQLFGMRVRSIQPRRFQQPPRSHESFWRTARPWNERREWKMIEQRDGAITWITKLLTAEKLGKLFPTYAVAFIANVSITDIFCRTSCGRPCRSFRYSGLLNETQTFP